MVLPNVLFTTTALKTGTPCQNILRVLNQNMLLNEWSNNILWVKWSRPKYLITYIFSLFYNVVHVFDPYHADHAEYLYICMNCYGFFFYQNYLTLHWNLGDGESIVASSVFFRPQHDNG